MIETLTSDWKGEVFLIFELRVSRTPGPFIEEKEFSLVWHCRKAEPRPGESFAKRNDRGLHII